ncbi:MAG: iron-sulfur cluster assembly protein [Pseudoalteromonas tetraodonis]|jgi:iron-sulfur cluster assembly protein
MAITLTDSAAKRVSSHIEKHSSGVGLRLGVQDSGCSGFAYIVDYAEEKLENDLVFDSNGVTVLVDKEALKYIDGTTVDFVKQGLNQVFRFRNPNIKDECGCGESFNV